MKTRFSVGITCAMLVLLGAGCGKSVSTNDVADSITGDTDVHADGDSNDGVILDVIPADRQASDDGTVPDSADTGDVTTRCADDLVCATNCVKNGMFLCSDGNCHGCCEDSNCNDGEDTFHWFCDPQFVCRDIPGDCRIHCPFSKPICYDGGGFELCLECLTDDDCRNSDGTGPDHTGKPFCFRQSANERRCVECVTDDDCANPDEDGAVGTDKPFCIPVYGLGRCLQCKVDADCTGISPACKCSEDAGWSCVMQFGTACQKDVLQCNYPEDLPTSWGPAGVANLLHVPANADEKAGCFDYTDDDIPDCGLTGMGSQINPPLADMISAGKIAVMLEFNNFEDLTDNPGFTLYGIIGTPVSEGVLSGDIYADTEDIWFNRDTCEPAMKFDAEIIGGVLTGQSDRITVGISITSKLTVPVVLIDAYISANLLRSGNGVEASDGVMSGVFTKKALTEIVDGIQAACDMDPQPTEVADICPYLRVSHDPGMLFDLHQRDNGTYTKKDAENPGDAMSVCIKFTLAPATIVGYRPAR